MVAMWPSGQQNVSPVVGWGFWKASEQSSSYFLLCPFPAPNPDMSPEVKPQSCDHKATGTPQEAQVPNDFVELLFQSQHVYSQPPHHRKNKRDIIKKKKLHVFSFYKSTG